MAPKIYAKSMKNRGCVFGPFFERQSGDRQGFCQTHLGAIFDQKSKKGIKKGMQKAMPKKY